MSAFAVFCFISLFLASIQLAVLVKAAEKTQSNGGVYIVYTGAASNEFHSDHIMSSSSIESLKDGIIHKYSHAFSGFAVRLSEEEAKLIAQRPEVVSVFPDPVLHLHTTRSWEFLKEQSVIGLTPRRRRVAKQSNTSSVSGEDVIIGIFDTGIWPEVKSFNDEGLGPIPKKWMGKCIRGRDFKPFNCNRKLIGARNYYTFDNSTSPKDQNGHGTHVAAIAAGRPVPGASYRGLAGGTARGGAPGARIAVYRICQDEYECQGSATLKAFDDAIADGVDVINLSFVLSIASRFLDDPISIGAFHAVENGILVVGSAGNGGTDPEPPTIQNVAPWILTVGATTIDRFFESDVVLGNNKVIKGGGVHSANLQKTPIYPLTDGLSAMKPDADIAEARSCYGNALDNQKVKGKIVLCEDSLEDATPDGQYEDIKSLGGIGMLYKDSQLVDSVSDSMPRIPISSEDGDQIPSYLNSTRKPVATILPTKVVANNTPAPVVALFSGNGPVYGNDYLIKPDVVAPGVDILSAWPSTETNEAFNILSGTSMACPHVSGVAALVKSRYPSWGPSAIKSAIMTTASQTNNLKKPITINVGNPADPFNMGAGEVTTSGPIQPGLVYETGIADYLLFLCNHEELISNMNYPSISVGPLDKSKSKKVKRTVTNVEESEESVYTVSIESTQDLIVAVNPATLHFTKEKKKLSYEATFRHSNMTGLFGYGHGSITWSNNKYRVRIPFTVIT
ncbi:OLC1v1018289C1 [Oldenlandia corymbosa var. corymbosa]|uniref:OLC1v1018289C1 n=1 Tax=Oldenlandia corymbosa var. corymbosa TaxID=529605 RepID=A0AAV1EBC4_OLDCO|nr:OLC1v1018289C1 [Oldenlandia corymbosa var. corymbosa]